MAASLQDKTVIVTGSGSGIGQAIAIAMADEGANVVVNDLGSSTRGEGADIALADRTVAMIRERGGEAVPNYDDVGSMDGAQGIIDTALSAYGRIDSLVNNAGIIRHNMLWNMSEDDFDLVVRTHLKGHFATIKAATPHMMEQRSGSIINIASTMGIDGGATVLGYSAAKAGILGLTLTAGLELGPYGIRGKRRLPVRSHQNHRRWGCLAHNFRVSTQLSPREQPGARLHCGPGRRSAYGHLSFQGRLRKRQRPGICGRKREVRRIPTLETFQNALQLRRPLGPGGTGPHFPVPASLRPVQSVPPPRSGADYLPVAKGRIASRTSSTCLKTWFGKLTMSGTV